MVTCSSPTCAAPVESARAYVRVTYKATPDFVPVHVGHTTPLRTPLCRSCAEAADAREQLATAVRIL